MLILYLEKSKKSSEKNSRPSRDNVKGWEDLSTVGGIIPYTEDLALFQSEGMRPNINLCTLTPPLPLDSGCTVTSLDACCCGFLEMTTVTGTMN